jgi:putative cofactor-binding repeat protein
MHLGRLRALGLGVSLGLGAGLLVALLGAAEWALAAPQATNLFVTPAGGGDCSQAAPCTLAAANGLAAPGDSLYLAAGTYTRSAPTVITLTKSITLFGGWDGAPAGPVVRDPSAYPSVLDGENARRVVGMVGNITPTLDGLVITRGNANLMAQYCFASSAKGCGGGIFVYQAHARIFNNLIVSNTALVTDTTYGRGVGGGILLEDAAGAVISGNVIMSNSAALSYQGEGGGMAVQGAVTVYVQNNTFVANGAAVWGGGISLGDHSHAIVQNNWFERNAASQGAGLYTWYFDGAVLSNTLTANSGDSAMYIGFANTRVDANRILDNATDVGLQLINGSPAWTVTARNNLIARNGGVGISLTGYSGGVLNAVLLHTTVLGAGSGNGISAPTSYVTATLTNTLIAGHPVGIFVFNVPTKTVSAHYTLFDTDVVSPGQATLFNPVFGLAAVDPDGRLLAHSAGRDAGAPAGVANDIDGETRPFGPGVDIGADETRQTRSVWLPIVQR